MTHKPHDMHSVIVDSSPSKYYTESNGSEDAVDGKNLEGPKSNQMSVSAENSAEASEVNSLNQSKTQDTMNLSILPMHIKLKLLSMLQDVKDSECQILESSPSTDVGEYGTILTEKEQDVGQVKFKKQDGKYSEAIKKVYVDIKKLYFDSNQHLTSHICTSSVLSYLDVNMQVLEQIRERGIAIIDNFMKDTDTLERFLKDDLQNIPLSYGKISSESIIDIQKRGDLHSFIHCTLKDIDTPSISKSEEVDYSTNLNTIIRTMRQIPLHMNLVYNCEFKHDSVQVAVYPADGRRYIKHADATPLNATDRRLTLLLYLNKREDIKGGSLRFYPNERSMHTEPLYITRSKPDFIDVEPLYNRLVVFPSDCFHEVLPSYFHRKAITLWCYSKHDIHQILKPKIVRPISLSQELETSTIFVSICSYRDSECGPTVRDLFYKCKYPDRVRVGILWQYHKDEDVNIFATCTYYGKPYSNQIKEIRLPHTAAKGPIYARSLIQKHLYNNEAFFLQIDSHMRFEKDWDVKMITQLQRTEATSQSNKCVISGYPPGYKLPNEIPKNAELTVLTVKKFASVTITPDFKYEMIRLGSKSILTECNHPIPTYFWAAGFSFSRGDIVKDAPYDESLEYIFFGEELLMAIKLFEQDYHIFCPDDILVYHLWSRNYRPTFRENEDIQSNNQIQNCQLSSIIPLVSRVQHMIVEDVSEHTPNEIKKIKEINMRRVMKALHMVPISSESSHNDSPWTRISSELLQKFEASCGINFKLRSINHNAKNGNFHQAQYLL